MKRNMELIRDILFKIERESKAGQGNVLISRMGSFDLNTVAEHCEVLYIEKYIKDCRTSRGGPRNDVQILLVGDLTEKGHDFLDQMRNK